MHLIVDGSNVVLRYLFFTDPGGQVAQIRIEWKDGMAAPLHILLAKQLKQIFEGVMSDMVTDEAGYTEIRVLNATRLEVIDAMRFFGLGVIEVSPSTSA